MRPGSPCVVRAGVPGKAGWPAVSGVPRAGLGPGPSRRAGGARLSLGVWPGRLRGAPVVPDVGTRRRPVWREGARSGLGG